MSIILTLLNERPFLVFPTDWLGWFGLVVWFGSIAILIRLWSRFHKSWNINNWILFAGLFLLIPVTSLFVGVRLPVGNELPLPEIALEPKGHAILFFSSIPWILAAGLLGPLPAAILAAASGTVLAFWDTHSIYTIFEITLLAVLLSALLGQRYRTPIYKSLRNPFVAAVFLNILYPLFFTVNIVFFARGSLTGQIDYAFTNAASAMFVVGVPLLIGGLLAMLARYLVPTRWGGQPPWQLAPSESSLEAQFFRNIVPLSLVLVFVLMVGDWVIAGNAARKILQDRMASAAQIAADGVPYFLDTGQSLILYLAKNPELNLESPDELQAVLERETRAFPFFRQLFVLDRNANSLTGYPVDDYYRVTTIPDELVGVDLALSGIPIQTYTLRPMDGESSAQVAFIAAIQDGNGYVQGVLIGRTDIQTNPYTKQIITSLESLASSGGTGFIIDENGSILYHSDPNRLMQDYPTRTVSDGEYYDETSPGGTRQLTYYKQAVGRPWAVVLTLPAQKFQQLSLNIAAPLLGMVIVLSVVAVGGIRFRIRTVTSSLKLLAVETDRIAQGQLDQALKLDGDDEVGQLRRSFDKMRISLKARLDELNRLLIVSQGVASNLEMEHAVQPILESALNTGASSARIVLTQTVRPVVGPKSQMPSRFGLGKLTEDYRSFDDQLLALMEDQDRIVLTNPARSTLLSYHPGAARPESLLSIALRHENRYHGTLWVAYDSPHPFTNEEVRFLSTLAGQAAIAAANTQLFWTAEYGRQRLAAILASTPDPVIVTDHLDRLLLVNPVALQVFGQDVANWDGKPIEDVISQRELIGILRLSSEDNHSVEVELPDRGIYLATASTILSDGQRIGRVCVLRDISHFKELDSLKSEFVATVSHDLRSPLTLIRGYATMLEMVGDLNEQQENYIRKIVVGVESMSRLITNLLDLGRIEAQIGLQLEKLPIRDMLEEITEAFRLQATQKQIKFHVEIPAILTPIIEADRSMLEQAFHNLLDNAIKYTPGGKDIWVRVKQRNQNIVFEVQDSGIGISPVDIPRLFEKFYRSSSREAKKQSGTGLGLAIVKSIANRHGGRVWVDSQLGKGSIFYLEIPLHLMSRRSMSTKS